MTFSPADLDEITEAARAAAEAAGALLLEGLGRSRRVDHKGEVDLVTEHDRRSEELIATRLERLFPEFAFFGEEGGERGRRDAESVWIVDPLDGTTNFAHGHAAFAVSIGLEHRGDLVSGVVVSPALGTSCWARSGGGAHCNGDRISVSGTRVLDEALLATGFPYDRRTATDDNSREFIAFMKRCQGNRRCGAAAVDMALVAQGVYDGFWEPRLHAWDLAAGVVLVREAGGRATDYGGDPVDVREGWIVASNGLVHDQMLEVISAARADYATIA